MFQKSFTQFYHKILRLRTATFSVIRAPTVVHQEIKRQPVYTTSCHDFEAPFLSFLRKILSKAVFFLCKGSSTLILSSGSVGRQASRSMVSNGLTLWYRTIDRYIGSSRLRLAKALSLNWRNQLSSLKWLRVMTSAIGGYHSSTLQYIIISRHVNDAHSCENFNVPFLFNLPLNLIDPTWTA